MAVPLHHLVGQAGEDLLEVLEGPDAVEVGEVAVHDPLEGVPPAPGALVLLVGLDPAAPEAARAVRGLAGAAAAVVGPCPDAAREPLAEAARAAGVTLLGLRWPLAWTHLYTLLADIATADEARREASGDVGGVPPGDLPALADAIAGALGRPAVIVDAQWRLLAYSAVDGRQADELQRETILNRAVPEEEALPAARRLLLADGRARRFGSRVGVGIRVGAEPRGMLWISEAAGRLPDDRLALLEEYARLAAAHLGQARAVRRRHAELAEIALEGGADAGDACAELGLDPRAGLTVVAVGALGPPGEVPGGVLLDGVAAYLDAYRRPAACVLRGDTVHCLLGGRAREIAADAVRRAGGRRALAAGVGDRVVSAAELPRSSRQAALVLDVLTADPRGPRVADVGEVRARAALAEVRHLLADHPELLAHETAAEEWVLAWLEAHGDYRAAAARLGVHPNTLRYRVRRLAEDGVDLGDPDVRLALWVRLRLVR
ncbi:PucR family transcriptional regulator [Nonomuraea pusilla]|uniref:PucR C-terminal helix-turn-helix domain-containing protein n=1 Tax=Nonomuraea pusilla TaxID=46177 RepID=A0A1H7NYA6_9ACTN|nr:helix-turn-helix domain-containing protein [Nonomuraea pusilla]SEL28366.1 PucR C-terminal helix-turn-helix domain-containing protein [Nonomuraea pusilla]